MCIVLVDLSRGITKQSDVEAIGWHQSDNLHTKCRDPRVKATTVPSQADEIFTNSTFDSIVQNFIYLTRFPTFNALGVISYW